MLSSGDGRIRAKCKYHYFEGDVKWMCSCLVSRCGDWHEAIQILSCRLTASNEILACWFLYYYYTTLMCVYVPATLEFSILQIRRMQHGVSYWLGIRMVYRIQDPCPWFLLTGSTATQNTAPQAFHTSPLSRIWIDQKPLWNHLLMVFDLVTGLHVDLSHRKRSVELPHDTESLTWNH